jgi:hypothetical protein
LITDKDGVVLSSEFSASLSQESKDGLSEGLFSAAFAMSVDQIGKLGVGETRAIYSFNGLYALVHLNDFPIVVTLVFENDQHLGLVGQVVAPLKKFLEPLKTQVANSESNL